MLHRVQVNDTSASNVQRRLRESGLHCPIAAKKPLLKDTNNKKRLAWAKKHEQWTLDRWKSVLWSDDLRMCGSHHEARRRRCDGALLVTVCDLFRIQSILNQHGYHSILQRYAIPSGFSTSHCPVFQQDNDPNKPPGCVRAI